MPFNILESITQEERLNFSQDFSVKRPGILDTIFPDVKTQFLKAEYYRLMAGQRLPEVAFVHALDTEAEIGTRPGFEKVLTEKLFIKRKINQSERLQQAIENGVPDDENLKRFVFDDAANLFEGVVARANVMKGQFLSTGAVKVKENNVDMSIDYGVPSSAKVEMSDWSKPDADIMGDIQKMVAVAEDNGFVVNKALTSNASKSIDDLCNKLNRLSSRMSESIKYLRDFSASVGTVNSAVQALKLDRLDLSTINSQLQQFTQSMSALGSLNLRNNGLNSFVNAIRRLNETLNSTGDVSGKIQSMISELSTLGSIPDVSNNVNRFISSLARLANAGSSIDAVTSKLPNLGEELRKIIVSFSGIGNISQPINTFVQSISQFHGA